MPSFHLLNSDLATSVPWSAGTGLSRELALWPHAASPAAGEFDVRLSIERVEGPGPFPSLAGFEHLIALLSEGNLRLAHGDDGPDARLRHGEALRFPGDWKTRAVGSADTWTLLSVCTRIGRARATMQPLQLGARELREPLSTGLCLVLVTLGALVARATGEDEPFELRAGDGLWVEDARDGDELALAGEASDTTLVLVHVEL